MAQMTIVGLPWASHPVAPSFVLQTTVGTVVTAVATYAASDRGVFVYGDVTLILDDDEATFVSPGVFDGVNCRAGNLESSPWASDLTVLVGPQTWLEHQQLSGLLTRLEVLVASKN